MVGVKSGTLHNWYQNHLSDFRKEETQQQLHHFDIPPPRGSEKDTIAVPILKPENIGVDMAIDEKYLHGKYYTILTNQQSGKIALMAATHRKADLDRIIPQLGEKRWEVKTLSRDLSPTYDWVGREHFLRASHIADKFHILRHAFDALHDLRIFYRQKLLAKKREQQEQRSKLARTTTKLTEQKLSNGDTPSELLARSIHLLYKYEQKWSHSQARRARILFQQYPDIQKAYQLIIRFREWYAATNIHKPLTVVKEHLHQWIADVQQSKIPELHNFAALVKRHEGVICNYFVFGKTNAKAEARNRVLQSLITNRFNTRNMDFVHFRLSLLLS